jgi:L-rhamnose isomerase/sugar isomerase
MTATSERPAGLDAGRAERAHERDFAALAERLEGQGFGADALVAEVHQFEVALPSWAFATGGTRFGRFPGSGEPRTLREKMEDAALVHSLTGAAPRISLHIPWDAARDLEEVRADARRLGIGFEAVGSKALTVWLADGSNYPGQMSLRGSFDRVRECLEEVYAAMPDDWRLFTEHKPYEPAFYATVVQDWGSSLLLAQALGPRAQCLVDLGHHLPNANIELIVARLLGVGKLGGFHFNDSKYGDDDLTAGSIKPYALFLIFHELVLAGRERLPGFDPAYMIDQSHNLKDPIEALLQTVDQLQQAYAKACLVDHARLAEYQQSGDVIMAERTLKQAYETDVRPLVAEARRRRGGALDPVLTFRASGYRAQKAAERPAAPPGGAPTHL